MTRTPLTPLLPLAAALVLAAATATAGPLLGKGGGTGSPGDLRGFPGASADVAPPAPGGPGAGPGAGPRGPQHGPQHGPGGIPAHLRNQARFWDNAELAEAIGLTEGQIEALDISHANMEIALEATEGSVRDAYAALRETVETDEPDLVAVNEAIDAATAAQNEVMRILLGHRVVVNNVLTADQEAALREYRRDNRPERPDRPNRPGEPGDRGDRLRGLVRELLEDGSLSPEDWETIEAILENLDPERADAIREHIRDIEENGFPERPRPEGGRPEGGGPDDVRKPARRK